MTGLSRTIRSINFFSFFGPSVAATRQLYHGMCVRRPTCGAVGPRTTQLYSVISVYRPLNKVLSVTARSQVPVL